MNKQGWTYKKLGEVCDIYQPKTLSTSMLVADGKYAVYGANGIIGRYDHYNHESSEVLMTCRGATCGTINISEPFSWINGNAMVIHPQSDELNKSFLVHALRGIDLSTVITGAAQPQITRQSLSPTRIPVPPLAEQERIVAELDLLSGIIEKKKEQLKAYDQLAQSIFYTMFGDPIDNPKGWEVKHLGEVCDFINGFAFKSDLFKNNGLPILRISNIQNNVVNEEGMVYFSPTDYREDFTKYSVNKGDIVIAMSGATTGKLGVYLGERTCYLNQRVGKFQVKSEDRITNKSLLYYLRTISKQILTDAMGVAQPNISSKQIKEYTIILPPLSLQEEFAEKVEAIERQKALVQQSIEETQTMFDYTMDKYFG